MFTGIIETVGSIMEARREESVIHFTIESSISSSLKVDQSLAHDGVCLTVTDISKDQHTVTAIDETLQKTNLAGWQPGRCVNLERAIKLGDRLDGHIVQGHVDGTGICKNVQADGDIRIYEFEFDPNFASLMIEKGSVCINGVSLTAFNVGQASFSVAIIPYTFAHTTFCGLQHGDIINLEFDLIGKYLARNIQLRHHS